MSLRQVAPPLNHSDYAMSAPQEALLDHLTSHALRPLHASPACRVSRPTCLRQVPNVRKLERLSQKGCRGMHNILGKAVWDAKDSCIELSHSHCLADAGTCCELMCRLQAALNPLELRPAHQLQS